MTTYYLDTSALSQLASALVANQALQAAHLAPLIFLSADDRLSAAATAEGLMVDNPNAYL